MNANKTALITLLTSAAVVHAEVPPMKLVSLGPQALTAAHESPATIGQLSDLARQKRIASQVEPVKPAAASTMTVPQGLQDAPAGMTIVPSTEIINDEGNASESSKTATKKTKTPSPETYPSVLAIVRDMNGARYVELSDNGIPSKYVVGQTTPSGWTVARISPRYVELSKPSKKSAPARQLTLSITNQ